MHRLADVLLGLLAALALALTALLGVPRLAGMQPLVVVSGSMRPAIDVGDVVVDRVTTPSRLRVGQVVTFRDPAGAPRLITHRLVGVSVRNGRASLVTKGDANAVVERFSMPAQDPIGVVAYRVPAVGHVMARLTGRTLTLVAVALPALVVAVLLARAALRAPTGPRPQDDRAARRARAARRRGRRRA